MRQFLPPDALELAAVAHFETAVEAEDAGESRRSYCAARP